MTHATTDAELRGFILDCLRATQPNAYIPRNLNDLRVDLAKIAKEKGLKLNNGSGGFVDAWNEQAWSPGSLQLNTEMHPRILDVMWELVLEGIVRPGNGYDDSASSFPDFHLTPFGRLALKEPNTPHDPTGYLKELKDQIANIDNDIVIYITESLETLRRNCLLSSTITLGCACEKGFALLRDALSAALNPADKATYDAEIERDWRIKKQHSAFKKWYDNKLVTKLKTSGMKSDWLTEMDSALTFVFDYFRNARNDAGHPTGASFTRHLAQMHLMTFRTYLRRFYDLIEWLNANKPV